MRNVTDLCQFWLWLFPRDGTIPDERMPMDTRQLAIRKWLQAELPLAKPPILIAGDASFRRYFRVHSEDKATLNLENNTAELEHSSYRVYQENTRFGKNNAWGTAEQAKLLPTDIIQLHHASYSTCSPLNPTWQITASQIKIDKKKKHVSARNAFIRLHNIPILYTPYISFSMNNERKSGFLGPLLQYSRAHGFSWTQPYYFNLAPNDDLTLNAVYMSKRGTQANGLFRYLTKSSEGKIYISFLPNDREFRKFKKNTFAEFPPPVAGQFLPYISELRTEKVNRGYFAFNNESVISDQWESNIEINYLTDPYYFRDFGATINEITANQLLNQANINYTGMHWNFGGLVLGYQTLHLIDQSTNPTVNQYSRLPELDISGNYPNIFTGTNFDVSAQAVNFHYHSTFAPVTATQPEGQRLHVLPSFNHPINWASGYLTPAISIDSTSYNVIRKQLGQAENSSRNIPIVDIDSGLYFDRLFHWGAKNYFQTLEPRLFYLYVPYINQDKYPNYDTQILPFSYSQLFAINRFTGFDRFQNANQVSFGLTSRILNADTAYQRLKADIGIGYYFQRPRVCLTPGCKIDNVNFTPLDAQLTYYPAQYWSTSANIAWDTKRNQTNNTQITINYGRDGKHIIGAGYTFVHAQPGTPQFSIFGFSNNSSIYNVHVAWPITNRWSAVGYLYYNVSKHHAENYFTGLQYDTCCWSFRFMVNKSFVGGVPVNRGTQIINKYNTNYIFQIQLKGIGSVGNSNPNALLTNSIPGYFDPFKY